MLGMRNDIWLMSMLLLFVSKVYGIYLPRRPIPEKSACVGVRIPTGGYRVSVYLKVIDKTRCPELFPLFPQTGFSIYNGKCVFTLEVGLLHDLRSLVCIAEDPFDPVTRCVCQTENAHRCLFADLA